MRKISLSGLWSFIPELDPKYHFDRIETLHVLSAYSKPDFDRSNWETVQIPGVWQKYGERYDIFEGACWFCREFELTELTKNSLSRIRFGAVNYFCVVYLNGKEAGRHEGGYTEFFIDVTKLAKTGRNHIAVRVDNRSSIIKWPPYLGYFNYGGIHRDVTLEIIDDASISDIIINSEPCNGNGELDIQGNIILPRNNLSLLIECNKQKTTIEIPPDGKFKISLAMHKVKQWSPETPVLYPISVTLKEGGDILDTYYSECGFRKIETQGNKILLNDKDLQFKGICYVYDSPVYGLYINKKSIENDIRIIKESGANAIRTHYPMDEVFYEICDKEGILVWIEPPIYCYHPSDDEKNTAYSHPERINLAKQMIREMIINSRNHASVVIYGIGNECNLKNTEAFTFFKELADTVHSTESGRLISYAALYGDVGNLSEIIDILGVNSYWGWYDKIYGGKGLQPEDIISDKTAQTTIEPIDLTKMREMLNQVIQANKGKPLFLTEFGADSVKGFLSRSRDLWSENYHAALLLEIFKLASEYSDIVGTFPFCFSDYRDPSKVVNAYWNELNLKGIVDYNRDKKLAFHALTLNYSKVLTKRDSR